MASISRNHSSCPPDTSHPSHSHRSPVLGAKWKRPSGFRKQTLLCPDTGLHLSRHQSRSLTAFEVWDVSPSLPLGGLYFCCTALLGRASCALAHEAAPRVFPRLGSCLSHYVLLLERSPTYLSLCHKKERGKEQQRVSRLANVCAVQMAC